MEAPLRVLVVEDSEDDTLLLLRELRRGGYEVRHERVDTPAGMRAALGRQAWDVVVSDHSMPAFSSAGALELLRDEGFEDVPFIIVSGRIGEDAAVAAMRAGARDYLMKDNLARLNSAVARELREAEARREKRRAEEKYRSIFENAVEGIFQTTAAGELVTANPAMARMLGYGSHAELVEEVRDVAGQLYADPEHRARFVRLARLRGSVSGFETELRRKDGGLVPVSISARTLLDESGRPAGYEGTMEDVTERRRAEAALRGIREAERRRIARDLHDEALQDLTYALQSLQLARRASPEPDPEQDRQIEALRRAVEGIRAAVYDLRLEGVRDRTFLDAVSYLVDLNRRMAPEREIEVVVGEGFPGALSGTVAVEMGRVVGEALANVRRHSGARRATVTLGAEGGEVWAEVCDDGCGFDPEAGGGVGISGMKERARALGGELEIRAREPAGTRVCLRVALPDRAEAPADAVADAAENGGRVVRGG